MAKCSACGREMLTAKGCTFKFLKMTDGRYVERQKVGAEGWTSEGQRCGDCGALYGHYHHPNCDIERCPICKRQLISCNCAIECYTTTK